MCVYSEHNVIKLEFNNRKISKNTNIREIGNTLLFNHWAKEDITKVIRK